MQISGQLNKPSFFRKASTRQRAAAGIVLLLVLGFFGLFRLWAAGKIDMECWVTPCGFKQQYDLPCPTCGMTTSVLAFASGKVVDSFFIQPAAALMCWIGVLTAFFAFIMAVFGVNFRFLDKFFVGMKIKYIVLALIIVVAAGWMVTLMQAVKIIKN